MILVSSNENKIKEFKKHLGNSLKIEKGRDLKEVDSTIRNVIIYKAKEAGKDRVVEDTVLIVDGKPVVDIRWKTEKDFQNWKGKPAEWVVSLGYNDGKNIYCYEARIPGKIVPRQDNNTFSFDPFFQPTGSNKTLSQLKTEHNYKFDARHQALMKLKNHKYTCKKPIKEIKTWRGRWQND
jgi:inosine/xanthosine triphosphate pyrophosphatase family protein